jgi:hypothetical protein
MEWLKLEDYQRMPKKQIIYKNRVIDKIKHSYQYEWRIFANLFIDFRS